MEKEVSKTARQQAVGETLAQKFSTFVKALSSFRNESFAPPDVLPNPNKFVLLTQKEIF